MSKTKLAAVLMAASLLMFTAGCKKKGPAPPPPAMPKAEMTPPPPPPPAQKPVISSFTAEPSTIERGASSMLRWSVSNATDITISQGIGKIDASGSRSVYPSNTTTYTLTAKGPGGMAESSATVNVTVPPPPPPPPPAEAKLTVQQRLEREVVDIYYDYDKNDIREDARAQLTRNADAMKRIMADFPTAVISVEGHCDERGSAEYNLGLGDRRATSAKDFLTQLGVAGDKLKSISYGKERPSCTDANEACWQKNRRAHFSAQ
jgi:peptidoglycan-associated lipoprotein